MDGSPYIFPQTARTTTVSMQGRSLPPLPERFRARPDRFAANEEPSLDDLLSDPLTASIMVSDGVRHERLVHLIAETRARLAD